MSGSTWRSVRGTGGRRSKVAAEEAVARRAHLECGPCRVLDARKMGATDYLTVDEEPVARLQEMTGGAGADLVFEAAGSEKALPVAIDAARRGGTIVILSIVGSGRPMPLEANVFCLKDLRIHGVFAYTTRSFEQALRLVESGRLDVRPWSPTPSRSAISRKPSTCSATVRSRW